MKRAPSGPRINLTVPPELDALLGRIAAGMGTGKASVVTRFMVESIEGLTAVAEAIELAKQGNVDSLKLVEKALDNSAAHSQQLSLSISKKRRAMPRMPK
jgi:hypothetical protein